MAIRLDNELGTFPFYAEAYIAGPLNPGDAAVLTQAVASIHANSVHVVVTVTEPLSALTLVFYAHGEAIQASTDLLGGLPLPAGTYTFKHAGFIGSSYRVQIQAASDGSTGTYTLWTAART